MKQILIFLVASFLYIFLSAYVIWDTIGKVFIMNFESVNMVLLLICSIIVTLILTSIYSKFNYYLNQYIYKFRVLLVMIPVLILCATFLITGFSKKQLENHNNNIKQQFDANETYLDLSENVNGLIFKINSSNQLLKLTLDGEKYKIKIYEPIKLEKLDINQYSKYKVYELNEGYLFTVVDNEEKNFYVKELNKDANFYQLNINVDKLQEYKNIELVVITDVLQKKYDQKVINDKVYASIQEAGNYKTYRQYFDKFYFLFKSYGLKSYIKEAYPNQTSISYSNDCSNVTVDNEVLKIYARINEKFELELYEKVVEE